MGKKNLDYVCVPRDEYDELIECRTHIDALYRHITSEHTSNIRLHVYNEEQLGEIMLAIGAGISYDKILQ